MRGNVHHSESVANSPYLTIEGKAAELARWAEARAERDRLTYDPPGGCGYADPPVYRLCDRLNALPGVCTLQSCAGHTIEAADGTGTYRYPGNLWVWLGEQMSAAFHRHVYGLACDPYIERISTLHTYNPERGPRSVIDIVFEGQERGGLAQSTAVIVDFFENLTPDCGQAI